MDIRGLQKTTLLDWPGRVACTVFMGGCDFRCPFCYNTSLYMAPQDAGIEKSALFDFLKKRVGILDGVCITGGEALCTPDIDELIEDIKKLGFDVKLDTNGNHPKKLRSLIDRGLIDYVAMDIKNSPERYAETVGMPGFDISNVLESASLLLNGNVDYEFRTTVVKNFHNKESFLKIGEWIRGAKRYFLQSFENRDSVLCSDLCSYTRAELEVFLSVIRQFVQDSFIRGVD